MVYWLWTEREGVYSGETALNLHELSDALPTQHLTLPESRRSRRLRVPKGIVLLFSDIPDTEWTWAGPVPVTKAQCTIEDCIEMHVQPDSSSRPLRRRKPVGSSPKPWRRSLQRTPIAADERTDHLTPTAFKSTLEQRLKQS